MTGVGPFRVRRTGRARKIAFAFERTGLCPSTVQSFLQLIVKRRHWVSHPVVESNAGYT